MASWHVGKLARQEFLPSGQPPAASHPLLAEPRGLRSPAEGAALGKATGNTMSTTALDVDSRKHAPLQLDGAFDLAQYTLEQVRRAPVPFSACH